MFDIDRNNVLKRFVREREFNIARKKVVAEWIWLKGVFLEQNVLKVYWRIN